jgi:outer membrane receptor protein involved in Fe transport
VPADFVVPPQTAATALIQFSQQANVDVLFAFEDLNAVSTAGIAGTFEPEEALSRLLRETGFVARRSALGKFIVSRRVMERVGTIKGRILRTDGAPARNVQVALAGSRLLTTTQTDGQFELGSVRAGTYRLLVQDAGFRPLEIVDVRVDTDRVVNVETHVLQPIDAPVQLAPQIVEGRFYRHWKVRGTEDFQPQRAAGNLDLPRSADDALPYAIYDREQITRSGMINLNDFLLREVLDANAAQRPPEQDGSKALYLAGSTNATLRGFGADETVVLVNGRRLPEVLVAGSELRAPPDVNFIPLSLVERIEVLPISASALYSGNPVGGVINIVLRPNVNLTEVTATYTNALGGFDAPQSTLSMQHGQSLLGGRLQMRLSVSRSESLPPTETELGYIRANKSNEVNPGSMLHRATPNILAAVAEGEGAPFRTSVAAGANGAGGLAAFAGRTGILSTGLFDLPHGVANTPISSDYLYGRRQQAVTYFGSATYDVLPWLQVGVDGIVSRSVANRGYDLFRGDLTLKAGDHFNPFPQQVEVSLVESAPLLGERYGEAQIDFTSVVMGVLLRLPAEWRISMDVQYGHSVTEFRGVVGVDTQRWQQLVDEGAYNPLRDTQVFGPPEAFYDRALVYYGGRNRFVTLGDYQTVDAAIRVINQSLPLPTGSGALSFGGEYRMNQLGPYVDERRFGDGSFAESPTAWTGRTVERISLLGELQAPLLSANTRPPWMKDLEADVAARYALSDIAQERNLAPMGGLKADFVGGVSLRGTVATSNRLPSPFLSRRFSGAGGEVTQVEIFDPLRDQRYTVSTSDALNPNLRPESAVTRTLGAIYQRGRVHRFRLAVDFVDTRKSGEVTRLYPQTVVNLEELFSERVTRNDSVGELPGRITSLRTGNVNLTRRHSQNWSTAFEYAWTECFSGRLDLYARWGYFQKYELQVAPTSSMTDELESPDGTAVGLLKHRSNFGAGWSNGNYGFGLDGSYFHSRVIPVIEWETQQNRQINPYWQFDAYIHSDLTRFLPRKTSRFGLRAQLRVNNVFDARPPRYANDPSGAGVQSYGDWRRQTYALSLQATF